MKIRSPLILTIGAVLDLGLDLVLDLQRLVGAFPLWYQELLGFHHFLPSIGHPTTSLFQPLAPSCAQCLEQLSKDSTSLSQFSELISIRLTTCYCIHQRTNHFWMSQLQSWIRRAWALNSVAISATLSSPESIHPATFKTLSASGYRLVLVCHQMEQEYLVLLISLVHQDNQSFIWNYRCNIQLMCCRFASSTMIKRPVFFTEFNTVSSSHEHLYEKINHFYQKCCLCLRDLRPHKLHTTSYQLSNC